MPRLCTRPQTIGAFVHIFEQVFGSIFFISLVDLALGTDSPIPYTLVRKSQVLRALLFRPWYDLQNDMAAC